MGFAFIDSKSLFVYILQYILGGILELLSAGESSARVLNRSSEPKI